MLDLVHGAHAEVLAALAPAADVARDGDARAPGHLTPLWLLAQLIPSPEIVAGEGVARIGLRWQVAPVLYSFGVNRRVSPWRAFIVEPFVRQSGSTELFLGPEYMPYGRTVWDGILWRVGARSYFPVIEYGDIMSVSIGTSYFAFAGRSGAAYEVGIYSLFGIVGAQLTWSPTGGPATWIATLRLRYF